MLMNLSGSSRPTIDTDPEETVEWRDAFQSLLAAGGPQRAAFMLEELTRMAGDARSVGVMAAEPRT